jgi:hypothetical protein
MSHTEAAALADELAGYSGKQSVTTRLATMERQCRKAGRLIRAMLRQTNSGDIWKPPPEACRVRGPVAASPAPFSARCLSEALAFRSRRRYTETGRGGRGWGDIIMNEDVETMKTYVAVINGEAVIAFRAMDDDDAQDIVGDEDGEIQESLHEDSGVVRADGSPLWDGKSEIIARPATEAEDKSWREARDADEDEPEDEPGESEAEDDSEIEDDSDGDVVYLIPVKLTDDEEREIAAD